MINCKEENMNTRLTEDKKKELIKGIVSKASKAGIRIEEEIYAEANKIVCIIKDSVSTWNEAKQLIQEVESRLRWSTACGGEDLEIISTANETIEKEIANILNDLSINISKDKVKPKSVNGDSEIKINEDGIEMNGNLKIKQEKEAEVINYLPSANMKWNLAPEFIEQITKEVIEKMKEDYVCFEKIQLTPVDDVNKITSNAGSSVIMDKEGAVTAKVGDTSVTTTKEGMICKVDNKTSNTEDIEVNKEKDSEASSITVNIKTSEIIQELINSYIKSLEEMSKAMNEFEEKANCEIEALKGEVNSLKAENDKLEEIIKKVKADHINFAEIKQPCKESEMNSNNVTSKTEGRILNKVEVSYLEAYKEIKEYLMQCKNIQLERIGTDGVIKVIRILKELKNSPYDNAISILNNCKTIIPCVSTVKTKNEKII